MRIAFTTFGCKINQHETESMSQDVLDAGDAVVPFDHEADVYVINTCSVTAKTDYQCRQAIRAAVRRRPGSRVVVTGCYAETQPEAVGSIPGVSMVLGNGEKGSIARHLEPLREIAPGNVPRAGVARQRRTRGVLKIQDGCDNRCSYCIVPLARGRSRSVPRNTIMGQFDAFASAGCPEVVLSGIHIGSYGLDLAPGDSLTGLVQDLAARRGGMRLRLSSIEPNEITDGIIALLGSGLCRHLHIPLQSGDDGILKAMNRRYTSGYYRDLVEGIAAKVPGTAFGADVMVGFPGEGEREFLNTCGLIEDLPLSHLHVFSYSPRPGTAAASLPGQVPEEAKKERNAFIRNLGARKNRAFRRGQLGKVLPLVLESKVTNNGACRTGLTDNYIRISIPDATVEGPGKSVSVLISEVQDIDTIGKITGNLLKL